MWRCRTTVNLLMRDGFVLALASYIVFEVSDWLSGIKNVRYRFLVFDTFFSFLMRIVNHYHHVDLTSAVFLYQQCFLAQLGIPLERRILAVIASAVPTRHRSHLLPQMFLGWLGFYSQLLLLFIVHVNHKIILLIIHCCLRAVLLLGFLVLRKEYWLYIESLLITTYSKELKKVWWNDTANTHSNFFLKRIDNLMFLVLVLDPCILGKIDTFLALALLLVQVGALPLRGLHPTNLSEVIVGVPRCRRILPYRSNLVVWAH